MVEKPLAVAISSNRYDGITRVMEFLKDDLSINDGDSILIKPNLVSWNNFNANTSYRTVFSLINFLKDNYSNLNIVVGEGSAEAWKNGKTTYDLFRQMKYTKIQERYREVIFRDFLEEAIHETFEVETIYGKDTVEISSYYKEFDYIISVALPKTHDFAIATLSIKNMMGLLRAGDWIKIHGLRSERDLHKKRFFRKGRDEGVYLKSIHLIHKNIVRLMKVCPPTLSIIDGFTGIEGDGPVYGKLVDLGIFIASEDPARADAFGVKIMGFLPEDIGYLYYVGKEGLGSLNTDPDRGDEFQHKVKKFEPHPDYELQAQWRENL